jgi:hypothetical protein
MAPAYASAQLIPIFEGARTFLALRVDQHLPVAGVGRERWCSPTRPESGEAAGPEHVPVGAGPADVIGREGRVYAVRRERSNWLVGSDPTLVA